jgi:hypothetical protein
LKMASEARWGGLLAVIVVAPAAFAQTTAPTSADHTPLSTATTAPTDSAAATGSASPVFPATGFGWTEHHKKSRGGVGMGRRRSNSPEVILPGFETLADGSTRLFVELSQPVSFDTKASGRSVTYVLKGAYVGKRNNYNPLVTIHFNTPVTVAELRPHGSDLYFVVDLRANVLPTATMEAEKDGSAILKIEFPKGDYLPPEKDESVQGPPTTMVGASSSPTPAPATSAPYPHSGAHGGHRHSH